MAPITFVRFLHNDLTILLTERTFPLSIKASVDTVQNIYKHSKSREEDEPHIGWTIERPQQEYVEEDRYTWHPWHQRNTPEFRLSCLWHGAVKELYYCRRYHGTSTEHKGFSLSKRHEMPGESE